METATRVIALALTAMQAFGAMPANVAQSDTPQRAVTLIPDGSPGRILKFEFCRRGSCDRTQRERWNTHYLAPPPGEVCRLSDVSEALKWLDQNRPGWLLAGWGCVSEREQSA